MMSISIIIVTHNSQNVLFRCLAAIDDQSLPVNIVLVDTGSQDPSYLDNIMVENPITVIKMGNIGFSSGNNIGFKRISAESKYILFLNPDVFLYNPLVLEYALDFMEQRLNVAVAAISGRLLSYCRHIGGCHRPPLRPC